MLELELDKEERNMRNEGGGAGMEEGGWLALALGKLELPCTFLFTRYS